MYTYIYIYIYIILHYVITIITLITYNMFNTIYIYRERET